MMYSYPLGCFLVNSKLNFPIGSLAQFFAYFESEIIQDFVIRSPQYSLYFVGQSVDVWMLNIKDFVFIALNKHSIKIKTFGFIFAEIPFYFRPQVITLFIILCIHPNNPIYKPMGRSYYLFFNFLLWSLSLIPPACSIPPIMLTTSSSFTPILKACFYFLYKISQNSKFPETRSILIHIEY